MPMVTTVSFFLLAIVQQNEREFHVMALAYEEFPDRPKGYPELTVS